MPHDHPHSDGANLPLARQPALRHAGLPMRGSARLTPGAAENTISLTFLLWVLRQWWKIVIPSGLALAVIAGIVVIYLSTPKYQASALLMIEDSTPFVAFNKTSENSHDASRYVETQLELLRSAVVLEPVLSHKEVADMSELADAKDRVKALRERMSVKQVGKSELYEISYTSPSPENAANFVNVVIAQYMDTYLSDEFQRSQRVVDILEEERRRRGLEVERLRKRVLELAKEVTGRDPFGGNQVTDVNRALNPVGDLFQSLTEADVEREVLRAQLRSLVDAPAMAGASVESSGLLDLQVEGHEDILARQKAIAAVVAKMDDIKNHSVSYEKTPRWETNPTYLALNTELAQRQQDLLQAKSKLKEAVLAQLQAKRRAEHDGQIAHIKTELKSLDTRRELLSKHFASQVSELQSGGAKSVELEFARTELEREEKVFDLIASRKLALQTELRAPARIQLRQKANVPRVPVEPIPYKLLLLVCSVALAAPFGLAILREITVRRITDVEQLAQESGLRILGEVASLPVRYVAISPRQISGHLRRDSYVFAESINSLRTNLSLVEDMAAHSVVAVTSASPGEGKSSVAVSLAMSISSCTDQPTLIIDGDMRSPSVATMLKTKSQPGLFEVLTQKSSLNDAIQRANHNELYVLPAGRATKSTHTVVNMTELARMLETLRQRFATIIIDTPPILGASESLILAKTADTVLFCALADISKTKQIKLALNRLDHAQVNVAGAVLSGTPAKRYAYRYGYYASSLEASD